MFIDEFNKYCIRCHTIEIKDLINTPIHGHVHLHPNSAGCFARLQMTENRVLGKMIHEMLLSSSERPKVTSAKPSAEASVVLPTEAEGSVVPTEGNLRLKNVFKFPAFP